MIKTILKEMMIVLLLCIAILFVLSILFYDYNPINKVVPNKIAYSVPENIRNELEEEDIKNTLSIDNKVYTVEGSDLNIYKRSNSYNPSKENPFASTASGESSEPTNTTKTNVINTNTTNKNTPASNHTQTNQNAGNSSSKTNTRLK